MIKKYEIFEVGKYKTIEYNLTYSEQDLKELTDQIEKLMDKVNQRQVEQRWNRVKQGFLSLAKPAKKQ